MKKIDVQNSVVTDNYSYSSCLILLFIIFLGLIVRALGVDFGLPFRYHNDEPIVVNYALAYGGGDLNPHFFYVPPLLSYFLFFEYSVYFVLGMISGVFSSLLDYQFLYLTDPSSFYLVGRISIGVVFGTLTILLLYLIGKRLFSEKVGLLSAFFLSLTFLHVRDSHYIYFDIPLTFFTLLTILFMFRFMDTKAIRDLILTSIAVGITTAIKYNGVLVIIPITLAYFLLYAKEGRCLKEILLDKRLYIIPLVSGLTFVVCNPFFIIDFRQFFHDMTSMPMSPPGVLYHLKYSLRLGMGTPLLILCLGGVIYAFINLQNKVVVLLVFIGISYAILCYSSQTAERYVLPIIPLLILVGAWFLTEILSKFKTSKSRKTLILVCSSILIVFPSAVKVAYSDYLFLQKDSRTIALEWIQDNIPFGTNIAVDITTDSHPRLVQSKRQLSKSNMRTERAIFKRPKGSINKKRELQLKNPYYPVETYNLFYLKDNPGFGFSGTFPDLPFKWDDIRDKNVQYMVIGGSMYMPEFNNFFEKIGEKAELLMEINPYKNKERYHSTEVSGITGIHFVDSELRERERNGGVIKIYRVKK